MHPILFQFGFFKIYSYGAMVALGFLACIFLAGRQAKRGGISPENIFDMGLVVMFFGIIGARALHVFLNLEYYLSRPLDIILINRGGLAIQGGLAAGIIAALIFIKRRNLPLWKTADLFAPYAALAQGIGRIGCYLNGCCYGTPTYLPWGISLPGHLQILHPTQLYTSAYLILAFFALKKLYRMKKFGGAVFFSYLLMFSAGRFFIDFFRGDLHTIFYGLRASQLISVVIFFIALACYHARKRKR